MEELGGHILAEGVKMAEVRRVKYVHQDQLQRLAVHDSSTALWEAMVVHH